MREFIATEQVLDVEIGALSSRAKAVCHLKESCQRISLLVGQSTSVIYADDVNAFCNSIVVYVWHIHLTGFGICLCNLHGISLYLYHRDDKEARTNTSKNLCKHAFICYFTSLFPRLWPIQYEHDIFRRVMKKSLQEVDQNLEY